MPRPYHAPRTHQPTLGYRAHAAQRRAQARARLALQAVAVALPLATVLLLWPYMVGVANTIAASLALPLPH